MYFIYFIFGVSVTLNLITIIGLYIAYRKFIKNNPLSEFYSVPKRKKKDDDIISKLKSKAEMENWDI